MACGCNKKAKVDRYTVKLPGGLKITKNSEAEARSYAASHPGSTVSKG